ncbi:unnamed protein product [Urochloa humidicola]
MNWAPPSCAIFSAFNLHLRHRRGRAPSGTARACRRPQAVRPEQPADGPQRRERGESLLARHEREEPPSAPSAALVLHLCLLIRDDWSLVLLFIYEL